MNLKMMRMNKGDWVEHEVGDEDKNENKRTDFDDEDIE